MEHGLKCELRPGKLISCIKCCKVKAKCKQPGEEEPERKHKQAQVEELEAGPSSSKKLKKTSEKRGNRIVELAEVLEVGLKAITDALSKQERLLQELVELEVDKVELMQLDQWVSKDEEDEEDDKMKEEEVDEMEEGEEVEVEQELLELAKEREENRDESEEEKGAEE